MRFQSASVTSSFMVNPPWRVQTSLQLIHAAAPVPNGSLFFIFSERSKDGALPPCSHIPEPHRLVLAGGRQGFPVGSEREPVDRTSMTTQCSHEHGWNVPYGRFHGLGHGFLLLRELDLALVPRSIRDVGAATAQQDESQNDCPE